MTAATISTRIYEGLNPVVLELAKLFEPPERLSVSEAAEKYVFLNNPGSYVGYWKNDAAPYMQEPMDTLAARDKTGLILCGAAQSAKTQGLLLNWLGYNVVVDPMDCLMFCPSQAAARDFSSRRIDRLHRHSPEIGGRLARSRDSDNKFDKHYKTGAILSLSWPSVTELAGRPVPRVAFTDYDRMVDDVEGEGAPFDLGSKRTTTFGSFAMTVAESSPSRQILDPTWVRKSPHEAPPCNGILGLYNRGDRRLWYWGCPHCGTYFQGLLSMLEWDPHPNLMDAAETVRMICPSCGHKIASHYRNEMNRWGTWLKDGQAIDKDGRIFGRAPRTEIASFWLRGPAANFVTWEKFVATFLEATAEYDRTGSEDSLKKFYNNDDASPYVPKKRQLDRLPESLKSRAEPLPEREVPESVRFLVAAVDVQVNSFVVLICGISPGEPFDMTVIDWFEIRKSERLDEDGERHYVRPGTFLEDWDRVTELVIKAKYPLADGSGRHMAVKLTGCDSGGRAGVTTNAYNYYRKLRKEGLSGRFHLFKGDHVPGAPRTKINFPDSNRKDKMTAARGDVPVLFFNSNTLKDTLNTRLDCITPTKGLIRFPEWLPDRFYAEMCAEQKGEKGWENPRKLRNEAWDCSYYVIGLCVSSLLRVEHIDWLRPPSWARDWDNNDLVLKKAEEEPFANRPDRNYDFAKLGRSLA